LSESTAIIQASADVSPRATIGNGTQIWHRAQIREGVAIGDNCIVGKDVYIDFDVVIGSNVKIQNSALIYHGVTLEDGVFVGPQVCLTNDRFPRAITPDGNLKSADDWEVGPTLVKYGASLGAGAIILPGLTIGRFAMVAAGSIVTQDVPDHALVLGAPAHQAGYVCRCGRRLQANDDSWVCPHCGWTLLHQER
jgi:acetyltransferase-like isoleucine patch superfamily enzyme